MKTETDYPAWICAPCGKKHGRGCPDGHVATFHWGTCGVCGKEDNVTQPRDYGGLKPGWKEESPDAR